MSGLDDIRQDWLDVFKAMKLKNNEIKKLNKIFNSVDVDKSGSIEVVELLTLLDIERTPFNVRIFAAFDKDRTGQIDLYEFVVSLWKFCTLGDGAISKSSHYLYFARSFALSFPCTLINSQRFMYDMNQLFLNLVPMSLNHLRCVRL